MARRTIFIGGDGTTLLSAAAALAASEH